MILGKNCEIADIIYKQIIASVTKLTRKKEKEGCGDKDVEKNQGR